MKKFMALFFGLAVVLGLASCTLESSTTIEFEKLPKAVYEANSYSDEQVQKFLEEITVKVNGESYNLTNGLLKVSGFDAASLSKAGTYTLTVVYNSASVAFTYTVAAKEVAQPVTTFEEFEAAAAKGGIIDVKNNIDLGSKQIELTESVTIYGNGHTISSTSRVFNIQGVSNININIYNLTANSSGQRCISLYSTNNVELKLEHCNLMATYYCLNLASGNEGTHVDIKESTLKGYAALNIWSNYANITIEKSELVSTWESKTERFGVIVFNGGGKDPDNIGLQAGDTGQVNNLSIKESTLKIEGLTPTAYILVTQWASSNNTINFDNCKLEYAEGKLYSQDEVVPASNKFYVDGVRK